jgi:hypothetical protein
MGMVIASILWRVFVLAVCTVVYFLPTIIGYRLHPKNADVILLLNLYLGWTFVGWVFALIWAFADKSNDTPLPR